MAEEEPQTLPFSPQQGSQGLQLGGLALPQASFNGLPMGQFSAPSGGTDLVMRALQGFASGMQGKAPPWQETELAKQRTALQGGQLGMQAQQLQSQLAQQSMDMFLKSRDYVQSLPEESRAKAIEFFVPQLMNTHTLVSRAGVPTTPFDAETAKSLLSEPRAMDVWLKNQLDASPEDLAVAKSLKTSGEAQAFLEKRKKERTAVLIPKIQAPLTAYIEQRKALKQQTVPGAGLSMSEVLTAIDEALEQVPEEQLKAQYGVTKEMAKDAVTQFLASEGGGKFLERQGVVTKDRTPSQLGLTETLSQAIQSDPLFAQRGLSIQDWPMLSATDRQTFGARAKQRIHSEQVELREAEARATYELEQSKLIDPKHQARLVDIEALSTTGKLVKPIGKPLTNREARSGRYADIEPEQEKALRAIERTIPTIDTLFMQAKQLFTETDPARAVAQGSSKYIAGILKQNPAAGLYLDSREGFLSTISKALGSEVGVLTDRDINRVKVTFPSFGDTAQAVALKEQIIRNIVATQQESIRSEVVGRPIEGYRTRMEVFLKELEKVHGRNRERDVTNIIRER